MAFQFRVCNKNGQPPQSVIELLSHSEVKERRMLFIEDYLQSCRLEDHVSLAKNVKIVTPVVQRRDARIHKSDVMKFYYGCQS